MPEVIQRDRGNPIIVVDSDEVLAWLRSLADDAGFADREGCVVQISVEQAFVGESKIHFEVPKLVFMVSNIPNSRKI